MSKADKEKPKSPTRLFLEAEIAKINQQLDRIEEKQQSLTAQQSSQAFVDAVLDGVRQLLSEQQSVSEEAQSEISRITSMHQEQVDELVRQRDSALDSVVMLQTEVGDLTAQQKSLKEEIERLKSDIETLTEQRDDCKKESDRRQCEIENLTDKLSEEQESHREDTERLKNLLQEKDDEMCRILSRLRWALFGKDDLATVEELEEEIERLKSSLTTECEKSEELTRQNGLQSEEISKLTQQAEEASKKIASLNDTLSECSSTITGLKKDVADREAKITACDETITDMDAKITKRDDKISDMEKQITALNDTVSSKNAEITSLNNDIKLANAENNRLSGVVDEHEKCRNEFNEAIAPFLVIFRQMQKCPSMQELLVGQFGLPVSGKLNIAQQVQFANCFSDRTYCAGVVYDAMKEYKKSNPEPMTEDERTLVSMLNDYYKNLFGISEDILDCLSIESGTVFNINEMRLITDPTVTWLSRVNYLCVPALRNQDSLSELAQKALIMGE